MSPRVLFGNRAVWYSIAALLVLQLIFTYAPVVQTWFDTSSIGLGEWGTALGFAIAIFLIVEVEKAVTGALERRALRS